MPGPVWLPPVVGDPAGMRALAGSLRGTAEQISGVDARRRQHGLVDDVRRTGRRPFPHGRLDERPRRTAVADSLQSLAGLLERSAAEVEQAQADRLRRLEEMARELEAARAQRAATRS